MAINPPFGAVTKRNNTPLDGMTTLLLESRDATQSSTLLRFLNFGWANSSTTGERIKVGCEIDAENNTSSVVLSFDHFGSDLFYDPGDSLSHPPLPLFNFYLTLFHRYECSGEW